MRILIAVVVCLAVGAPLSAQAPDKGRELVSIELHDVSILEAVKMLFKERGISYVFDRGVSQETLTKVRVELEFKNVELFVALRAILQAGNLIYRKDTSTSGEPVYVIFAGPGRPRVPETGEGMPVREPGPRLVTMRIPQMSIKEAGARLDAAWAFKDDLGDLVMPGVSFYRFPQEAAEATTLIAAGLVPPTTSDKVVTTKGKASLSSMFQWIPPRQEAPPSTGFAGGLPPVGYGGWTAGYGAPAEPAIAIGAYKSSAPGNPWLFTVLVSQAPDVDVIEALFTVSGRNFVMGDLSQRPFYSTVRQIEPATKKPVEQQIVNMHGPWNLSAQMYDVTLDEALASLMRPIGLTYRKQGPPGNPTYIVDTTWLSNPRPLGGSPASSSTAGAGRAPRSHKK